MPKTLIGFLLILAVLLIFAADDTYTGKLYLNSGTYATEISADTTLATAGDTTLVTEKAIKTYVDNAISVIPTVVVEGTVYEITVTATGDTLYTASLPDDVVIGDSLHVTGNLDVGGNITGTFPDSLLTDVQITGTANEVTVTGSATAGYVVGLPDSVYLPKAQIDTLAADTLHSVLAQIDTLSFNEMLVTTAYIDSGTVIFTDYDDDLPVMSYEDTVLVISRNVEINPAESSSDTVLVLNDNIIEKREIDSNAWSSHLLLGVGTSPNLPYWTDTDSLGVTLIEYSADITHFNQSIDVEAIHADTVYVGSTVAGVDTLFSGTTSKSVIVSGCKATDYIFITNRKPAGAVDILQLYVDCLADSFIVYTDNADTLATDIPFNWLRIKGE